MKLFNRRGLVMVMLAAIVVLAAAIGSRGGFGQLWPNRDSTHPSLNPITPDAKIYALELARPLQANEWTQLKQKYNWTGENYGQVLLVRGKADQQQELARLPFVQTIEEFMPTQKIDRELQQETDPQPHHNQSAISTEDVMIFLYGEKDKPAVLELINQLNGQVVDGARQQDRFLHAVMPAAALAELASSPGVLFVEKNHPVQLLNDRVRDITGTLPVAVPGFITGTGLGGQGQTIGLADSGLDTGRLNDLHPDFQTDAGKKPRIIMLKSWGGAEHGGDTIGHGTHMAGTLVGSGHASGGRYAGVAPQASLYVQGIVNSRGEPALPTNLVTLYRPAYEAGVRVHVNGWGRKTNSYTGVTNQIDDFVRRQPDFLAVFGSGNFGPGSGSITAEANSKNALVIGATVSPRPALQPGNYTPGAAVDFSSRGPAADGRIKPELLAPGTSIISAASRLVRDSPRLTDSSRYTVLQGTSMASAVAGGAAALLREYFARQHGLAYPSAALLKAALINGADGPETDQSTAGQCFGVINLTKTIVSLKDKLVYFEDQAAGVKNGEFAEYKYTVTSPDRPFKATLAWTDPPGLPGAAPALVNNLDLVVITPGGERLYGNDRMRSGRPDNINNSEQVYITRPAPGVYTVRVMGQSVVQKANQAGSDPAQDFALVYGQPALSAEVTDFDQSRSRVELSAGEQYDISSKKIHTITNSQLYPGDSKQIKPGSQLYAGGDNIYFVTRTWREYGLQIKKNAAGWLWFKTDPHSLEGGYYSTDARQNISVNGVKEPDLDLSKIPPGFEVVASINPIKQVLRQAEIAYTRVDGFVEAIDTAAGKIKLIGDAREYKLAPDISYLRDDKIVATDPIQSVFGSATGDGVGQLTQGAPVSLMVAPSARQVQSIAVKRTVAVGIIQVIDSDKQTLVLNGKTYHLVSGAALTRDGNPATMSDIEPGQLATLVLIDARGEAVGLSAYTNHHLGQISYIQASTQTIYLKTPDGTLQSLKITPATKIYRWGAESDLQALVDGMLVRVILMPKGQEIWRLDAADALTENNKEIASYKADLGLLTTRDGTDYFLGAQSRILWDGIPLPPGELMPGGNIQKVTSLLNPRDRSRVVVQMEAAPKPGQPVPQLRVSSIPFIEDYWIAGETTGQRLYLYRGSGGFERVPVSDTGRFSLGYKPIENQQYLYLIAASGQAGAVGTRLNMVLKKQKNFTDVTGHWAGTDLNAMAREGLISGYPDGTYRPNQTVSRVEFYALLARAFGWYADLNGEQAFNDWHRIPAWAKQALGGAMAQNIVSGYPDGSFSPLKPVTRVEQGAVLARVMALHRLEVESAGNPDNPGNNRPDFADTDAIPGWAKESVHKVCAAGIMQGQGDNCFVPYAPATRAETAVTIYRLLQKIRDSRG